MLITVTIMTLQSELMSIVAGSINKNIDTLMFG